MTSRGFSKISGAGRYLNTVLATPGLHAYFPLQEPSGSVVYGKVAGGDGSLSGSVALGARGPSPIYAPRACAFSGGSISIARAQPQSALTFSFEVWVRCFATASTALMNGRSGNDPGWCIFIGGLPNTAAQGLPSLDINGSNIDTGKKVNFPISSHRWHHLVATWAGTSGQPISASEMSIYIDGVLQPSSTTSSAGPPTAPFSPLGISFTLGDSTFSGLLSHMAMYSTALSAEQILAHYKAMTT